MYSQRNRGINHEKDPLHLNFFGLSFQLSDFNKLTRLDRKEQLTHLFSEAIQLGVGTEKLWSATSADSWGLCANRQPGPEGIQESLILLSLH